MDLLSVDLKSCNGINNLSCNINLNIENSDRKIAIIYAPNGTMKSSLAKTLKAYSIGEKVQEYAFGDEQKYVIKFDGRTINPKEDKIYVFDPGIDEETHVDSVLVSDDSLRKEYEAITEKIRLHKDSLIEAVRIDVGFPKKTKIDVVESTLTSDFGYSKSDIYSCISGIKSMIGNPLMMHNIPEIYLKYETLFSGKVISFFQDPANLSLVEDYEDNYQKILRKSNFFEKSFDHVNLDKVNDSLTTNGLFKVQGKLVLRGKNGVSQSFSSESEINCFLAREKEMILESPEMRTSFDNLSKKLRANPEMRGINALFTDNPDLIREYTDINRFKKKIWITAFSKHEHEFNELISLIEESSEKITDIINKAKSENRVWNNVIDEFNRRFSVPFQVSIANQKDVIINNYKPEPRFDLIRADKKVIPYEENNLKQDILSFGEVRALRILHMIFDVTTFKENGTSALLVFDDIADSFDYKNKYAIIEYLDDIADYKDSSGQNLFSILLLTHNFDFYRTSAHRLDLKEENLFIAEKDDLNNVEIKKSKYFLDVFNGFRTKISGSNIESKATIISSISFVRNLIGYKGQKKEPDYMALTNMLHFNPAYTSQYDLRDLDSIFKSNWANSIHINPSFLSYKYLDFLYDTTEDIVNNKKIEEVDISYKIVLSIAIRLKAEEYMHKKLPGFSSSENQTGKMIKTFKTKYGNDSGMKRTIQILSEVSLMTSENIHINSFMYEPILDISSNHLYKLYQDVKTLK